MTAKTLGEQLKQVRDMRGWTLRQTAEKAQISATYLQKLERGAVKAPSPNVLYALAQNLNVPYSKLMQLAGYVVPRGSSDRLAIGSSAVAHALTSEDLTNDEAEVLAQYLSWYRSQNRSSAT